MDLVRLGLFFEVLMSNYKVDKVIHSVFNE
jgi:hypothetical protein